MLKSTSAPFDPLPTLAITIICETCGEITTKHKHSNKLHRFCPECLRQRGKAQAHERYLKWKAENPTNWNWWSKEKDEKFIKLFTQGLPHSQIAAIMGISRGASAGRAFRLGLPKRCEFRKASTTPLQRREKSRNRLRLWRALKVPKQYLVKDRNRPPVSTVVEPPLNLPITELSRTQCRFIPHDDGLCCGHQTHGTSSWCAGHYEIVFRTA